MASSKPPLLFIHGFRGNNLGLEPIAKELSEYDVFVPSIPPASKQSLLKYDADRYAEWIVSYITKNKLRQPVLIGHSMGSIIASAVAQKYPQLINRKLILLAPISSRPNPFFAMLSPLSAILPNGLVDYITTKYLVVTKDKGEFAHILDITHQCSADYSSKSDVFKTAQFSVKHAIEDFDFNNDTLIISGAKDRLIPRKKTEALADKINAQAIFLNDSGHLLNYEKTSAVADAIRQFLVLTQ